MDWIFVYIISQQRQRDKTVHCRAVGLSSLSCRMLNCVMFNVRSLKDKLSELHIFCIHVTQIVCLLQIHG